MTWVTDVSINRPTGDKRDKMLIKRADLVRQIETLSMQPIGKTQTAVNGRLEDLTALASKIKKIDTSLGRIFA